MPGAADLWDSISRTGMREFTYKGIKLERGPYNEYWILTSTLPLGRPLRNELLLALANGAAIKIVLPGKDKRVKRLTPAAFDKTFPALEKGLFQGIEIVVEWPYPADPTKIIGKGGKYFRVSTVNEYSQYNMDHKVRSALLQQEQVDLQEYKHTILRIYSVLHNAYPAVLANLILDYYSL